MSLTGKLLKKKLLIMFLYVCYKITIRINHNDDYHLTLQ